MFSLLTCALPLIQAAIAFTLFSSAECTSFTAFGAG